MEDMQKLKTGGEGSEEGVFADSEHFIRNRAKRDCTYKKRSSEAHEGKSPVEIFLNSETWR